jgi:hypothetical protein
MKKFIAGVIAAGLLGCSAHAQGTVAFVNLNGAAGLNSPVFLPDGRSRRLLQRRDNHSRRNRRRNDRLAR